MCSQDPPPRKDHRARNRDSSEAGPTDGTQADVVVLLATGSHLGIRLSAQTSTPPTSLNQEPDVSGRAGSLLRRRRKRPRLADYPIDPNALPRERRLSRWPTALYPLKSVAGYLSAVLEHCDQTTVCHLTIESLMPRVEGLTQSLNTLVPEGEVEEEVRRKTLKWKLDNVLRDLVPLVERGKITRLLNSTKDVDRLGNLAEDIRIAIMDYHASLRQDIYDKNCRLIEAADLTLLNSMHHVVDAGRRSGDRQRCLNGTGKVIIQTIERWFTGEGAHRVFWLYGLPGTGKSTISHTFAEMSFADGRLGASFFCSRDCEDRSSLHTIFPTLASQLAYQYPPFREQLVQVLRADPDVGRQSLCFQMEKLIVGPLKVTRIQTLIIIDGLDECKDEEPASAILSILSRYVDQIPDVKFFITGQPEPRIHSGFRLAALQPITETFRFHSLERSSVDNDIKLFLRARLTNIVRARSNCDLRECWPSSSDLHILCDRAAGLFSYASTVVRFIESGDRPIAERLTLITSLTQCMVEEGKSTLDTLYTRVLEHILRDVHPDDEGYQSRFRSVAGAVLLIFNPLSIKALSTLLGVSGIPAVLHSLRPLFFVPNSGANSVRVFHGSFPDFLMDPGRCEDQRFFINPSVHHREILFSCLTLMKVRLRKNICDLDDYVSLGDIEDIPTRSKAQIGDALGYACRFWAKHLAGTSSSGHDVEEVCDAVDEFFTTRLLFWIEALIVMGNLDAALPAINDIQRWYASAGLTCKWAADSQCFILEHIDAIRNTPSEIYHHALPFSPSSSWLRKCYSVELSREAEVVKGQAEWGTCLRRVSFENTPLALACWKGVVVVGFDSGDIIILDTVTQIRMSAHSRHRGWVRSLALSSAGMFVASGGDDKTAKFWDIQTGGVVRTFYGHTDWVYSVSVSMDRTTIASGSADKTIRLWDVRTGECRHVIHGDNEVISVDFSPTNPRLLMSASSDHTVRWWDIEGRRIGSTCEGDHVASSADGSRFVTQRGRVVTVRKSGSGAIVSELQAPNEGPWHCCFSPDGKLIAGVIHRNVYVWDIASSDPRPVKTFVGHTDYITSLVFSSSLITSSSDGSIRFWQVGVLPTEPVVTDPEDMLLDPAAIVSVSLPTNEAIAVSCDSGGVVRTWDISTGLCKASFSTPARWPGWGEAELIDGRLIFGWCSQGKIHLYDTETGEIFQTVDVECYFTTMSLKISRDGSKVFLLTRTSVRVWSIQTGEIVGNVGFVGKPLFDSLVVDGSRAWVHFEDSRIQGWDFGLTDPSKSPVPLPSSSPFPMPRHRLDFIDRTVAWHTVPSRIGDLVTGEEVFRLGGKYKKPNVARWDGRYLVAGYESGEVVIVDLNNKIPQ